MNWYQLVWNAVFRRGRSHIVAWFILMTITWFVFANRDWSYRPLSSREMLAAGFIHGVLVIVGGMIGTRLIRLLRRKTSAPTTMSAADSSSPPASSREHRNTGANNG